MEDKAKFFKALGDETRLKIVECILKRDVCACEFPAYTKRDQTTNSRHLKVLTEAGVLKSEKNGRFIYYSIKDKKTEKILLSLGLKPSKCC